MSSGLPDGVFHVRYTCHACDAEFRLRQGDPEPDEEVTLCGDCLNVIFNNSRHGGSHDDPWTRELLRQARGIDD